MAPSENTQTYIIEGGIECFLHEFDVEPLHDSSNLSHVHKQRGRPRKGFEHQKLTKHERQEQKDMRRQERKLNKMLLKSQLKSMSASSSSCDSFSSTPKKRGRPPKPKTRNLYPSERQDQRQFDDILTPSCSDSSPFEEFSMMETLKLNNEEEEEEYSTPERQDYPISIPKRTQKEQIIVEK